MGSPGEAREHADAIRRAREAADAIEDLLPGGGGVDPDALSKAKASTFTLRISGLPLGEKPGSLEGWLDILFSDRKHRKWDDGSSLGVDRVRGFIRSDLSSIRMILDRVERTA